MSATPVGNEMFNAFKLYSIHAAANEYKLEAVIRRLRSHGIEPVLAKGWAIARLYPAQGLRPYGDFDICVAPHQSADAAAAAQWKGEPQLELDIHRGFRELQATYAELLKESVEVPLGRTSIRVLSPEHHFRLLCIHMLYHGAWKPVWLCDIALLLETAGPAFDWERCLSGDGRHSEWVLAAIGLAHHVLGAELPAPLGYVKDRRFPPWLFDGLVKQWGKTTQYMLGPTAAGLFREGRIVEALRSRWPNPLQATVRRHAGVNWIPRLPFQLADLLKRASRLVTGAPNEFDHP